MAVRDPKTEWLRIQIYRNMPPEQKMWIAAQLYEDGVAMVRASILDRHPDLSPKELERQVRRRLLPRPLFEKVETALRERNYYDTEILEGIRDLASLSSSDLSES